MKEKDIQNYLFENPEYLFPKKIIQEKAKEYLIKGKRIDLLFRVDGIRYIVEIKKAAIRREDIGQILEYYGLMKTYLKESNLKLILVAPYWNKWQITYLEELGIRCVEFDISLIENNSDIKESQTFQSNFSESYWVIFLDKIDEQIENIIKKKNEDLKNLYLFNDGFLNMVSFPSSHKRLFVRTAKVSDFVLQISHLVEAVTVVPFRRIIKIEEKGDKKLFFLEARKSEKKSYLSFNTFKKRLLEIDKNVSISNKSIKRLKNEEIAAIKSVFESY